MNTLSRKHFLVSVALVGLMIILGQTSVFAQTAAFGDQDASPSATIKQQILNGGLYQVIDTATAPCSGQCAVGNWQTNSCTCPQNFGPAQFARTLISVGSGAEGSTCGSTIFVCVWQQQ